ncbi:protein-glutamate methylesterase/protein-glutamine glutaminase [Limisalsivibrio acetivorans]|uniref:protein-glutamate methylesterase/protein-glutamine glutaminase n=1 Tax=Limisalsivibrio acetivorans TaxID=1304888 RepID=UPI0003B6336C|nr:chemotaxis response regulator protein-glutamate methylesterase [Limisalsivibrio acetivorans]
MSLRVLIADDSALMRKKIREMIDAETGMEVVGTARDGEDAVIKARDIRPDVITMDINMPRMDGLAALSVIVEEEICPVIMLSSLTQEGAETTFEAMELGAFDFVSKPGGTISVNIEEVRKDLIRKLKAAGRTGYNKIKRSVQKPQKVKEATDRIETEKMVCGEEFYGVGIGISTGGPKTIFDVLPNLNPDSKASFFLVQHMPPTFTSTFAKRLNEYCTIEVKECEAGEIVRPGVCYLGKGGSHMTLYKKHNGCMTVRLNKRPEHNFMPSVDIMLESVLSCFNGRTIGIIMTGMGDDGADSMVKIKRSGGYTIAESDETCVVFGMPKEAIDRGGADIVLPSYKIADEITKRIRYGW